MLQKLGHKGAIINNAILSSLDALTKWEAERKITGGVYVGARAVVFVVEAESNEEVDKLIQSLPLWGLLKWSVSPLQTFAGRADQERQGLEKAKAIQKK